MNPYRPSLAPKPANDIEKRTRWLEAEIARVMRRLDTQDDRAGRAEQTQAMQRTQFNSSS